MKYAITIIILLIAALSIILTGCSGRAKPASEAELADQAQLALDKFVALTEDIQGNNISLTIYHFPNGIETRAPIRNTDELIANSSTLTIEISPEALVLEETTLQTMDAIRLRPTKTYPNINIRTYYIFRLDDSQNILEIIINDFHRSVFVNGHEVEYNDVFYELIEPFLPLSKGQGDGSPVSFPG